MKRPSKGVAALALAFVVAAVVSVALYGAIRPAAFGQIHDRASLPNELLVCARTYKLGGRIFSRAEITKDEATPDVQVVQPAPVIGCPRSPRAIGLAQTDVWTVLFVRVGADEFASYELQGGP